MTTIIYFITLRFELKVIIYVSLQLQNINFFTQLFSLMSIIEMYVYIHKKHKK